MGIQHKIIPKKKAMQRNSLSFLTHKTVLCLIRRIMNVSPDSLLAENMNNPASLQIL
jgi:hypothetical protein